MVPQPAPIEEDLGRQTADVSLAAIGDRVRNVREPQAMCWGRVAVIQDQAQPTLAEIPYLGADILIADDMQFVPWFNLEKVD